MVKEYMRIRRNPKNPEKTGVFKPCKECGKEFESQGRFNVYCWDCNDRIERRSKTQRVMGVW